MKHFTFNYFSVILSIFYLLWTPWSLKLFFFQTLRDWLFALQNKSFPSFFDFLDSCNFRIWLVVPLFTPCVLGCFPFDFYLSHITYQKKKKTDISRKKKGVLIFAFIFAFIRIYLIRFIRYMYSFINYMRRYHFHHLTDTLLQQEQMLAFQKPSASKSISYQSSQSAI